MTKTKEFSRHERKADGEPPKKCLHCENDAQSRGLCISCVRAAERSVSKGKVTWDFLEEHGLSLPRPPKIPFLAKLEEVLKKTETRPLIKAVNKAKATAAARSVARR